MRDIGALGSPTVNPVFEDFAKTNAITLCEPGITTALEFKDGKLISVILWAWKTLIAKMIEHCGEGEFFDLLSKADLISIVNWTMILKMTALLVEIADKRPTPPEIHEPFLWLGGPSQKIASDINEVLQVLAKLTPKLPWSQLQRRITSMWGFLIKSGSKEETDLKSMAAEIRRKLGISTLVLHPVESLHVQPRMANGGRLGLTRIQK